MKIKRLKVLFGAVWQEVLVYRGAILFWTLILTLPFFLMYFVWTNIYESTSSIAGFNLNEIITYYFLVMIVMRLVESHTDWSINWHIKDGQFSKFLVQPLSPITYFTLMMVSYKILMSVLSIPLFFLIFLFFSDLIQLPKGEYFIYFIISLFFSSIIFLIISYLFGFLAFWVENAEGYLYMKEIALTLLAGAMIPFQFVGGILGEILRILPFSYLVSFPLSLYLGKIPQDEILLKFAIEIFWIAVFYFIFKIVYKRGIKRYSAVGN